MIRKLKDNIATNWDFWVSILCLVVMTGFILYFNNFSEARMDNIAEGSVEKSMEIQEFFKNIEKEFNINGTLINKIIQQRKHLLSDKEMLKITENEINSTLSVFLKNKEYITGYFYELNTKTKKNKNDEIHKKLILNGKPTWLIQKDQSLVYTNPLYIGLNSQDKNYVGFIGLQVNKEYLQKRMGAIQNLSKEHYILLVTKNNEIIYSPNFLQEQFILNLIKGVKGSGYIQQYHNSKKYLYCYNRFLTGQTYIEIIPIIEKTKQSNRLILLISFIAIMIIIFMKKNHVTKTTLFESVTERIIRKYRKNLNPQSIKGQKAIIALHVGLAGAVFADILYNIILGKKLNVILEYCFFFLILIVLIISYMRSRKGITKKTVRIISTLGLSLPVIEHISVGGFKAGRAGESMLWLVATLYVSLFVMGGKKSVKIFNIFVVILFLDLLIEIFFLNETNYERIYSFITSFFFLGLACFISMRIYVTGSENDYKKEEELITQLENSQSMLIEKEKMSVLGQLISGVANDINKPIGAIKASAETMEASFENFLRTLMKAGEKWNMTEYEYFEKCIVLSLNSKAQMKPTMEIRTAKNAINEYLESKELPNAIQITNYLVRLEIIDLQQIKNNVKIFKSQKVCEILKTTIELSAFLTGIPTTIYATDQVSKMVSALKFYIHSNPTEEEIGYHIEKNIDNVLMLFHNQLKVNIRVEKEYEKNLPTLKGNREQLSQVWTNLIQNAIYEMKELGGVLKIKAIENNGSIVVTISDTGEGIPDSIKDKIFDPFFTTKDMEKRSGLGLSIVKKIVEQHNGTIELTSKKSVGTEFCVRFPI